MIEVILLERIERLGPMGQVVKVKPGFARNFLLPQNKALRATKSNMELFEKQRAELEAKNAAQRAEAEKLAKKIEGLTLTVIRQASETGQLYGSVSARDIAESAADAKQPIERLQVQIGAPIKALGLFPVKIKLHPEVTTDITINVARSTEEAAMQLNKSKAAAKEAAAQAELDQAKANIEASTTEAPATATEEKPKKAKKPKAKKGTEDDAA
jgi:large subunit ribosomal protein L9